MTLLLLLLAFPGQRFANLPTGVLPESHVWQVTIAHRFLPAVLTPGWTQDPVQAFTAPNVRIVLDKSLGERTLLGAIVAISSRELGLRGAYAPLGWLTIYPELNAHLYDFKLDSTWFNLGFCCHRTFGRRWAVAAQPRYTTNTTSHFISLGLAAKTGLGRGYAVALEAEPVLIGRDSTTRQLAASLAIEKEIGWHNFIITVGTPHEQSAPAMFRSSGPATAYSDVLDMAKGWFRIGFNIHRKF
ncbi:MAG: DUF5777 family beta-barrel protein [candidate division WOR-3 bacterium]|nr:DUF5777 family beta-barrel protein [candidate division WOR-3 bacterium]